MYRHGRPTPSHVYAQETRMCARHVDHHTNSPSIDRFVVADGTVWRAASPTRLRVISTGAALASALQPYAAILRHRLGEVPHERSTREHMRPSEPSMVQWAAVDGDATGSHAVYTFT